MESCWHSCNYRKVSFKSSHWFCISLPFRIQRYFLFYSEACNWTRNSESDSEYLRLNIRYSCSCLENEEVVSNSSKWLHIDKSDVTDCEWNWKTFTIIAYFILSAAICILLSLYLCTYLWQFFQSKYLFTQERCFLEGPAEWWVYVCVKRWLAVSRSSKTLGTWKLMTSLFSVNGFQAGSLETIAQVSMQSQRWARCMCILQQYSY